jgi:DnaJ-class molecular chaperone
MFPTETNNNASSNTNDEYSSSNADSSSPAPNNDDDNTIMSLEEELFELLQDHRDQVLQKSSHTDPSQARLQLEMAWQMQQQKDECEVEQPETCSDRCLSCHGTGNVLCRFCQGTKVLALQGMAQPQACNVCQAQGIEECAPCRGAGWIANWTQLKLQAPV